MTILMNIMYIMMILIEEWTNGYQGKEFNKLMKKFKWMSMLQKKVRKEEKMKEKENILIKSIQKMMSMKEWMNNLY
jgi:hypothetical protein